MPHPFDRYAAYTDVEELKRISAIPLRKCLRVNTLKSSIAAVEQWAQKEQWKLDQIPWCNEGFFVDREDRSTALGKDLLHLLGHIYMQEASSMLPPALLQPKPGDVVLDMSAAPGSKTTQMAAMLRNSGVIVANDIQEKRLWTLKSALYRAGVVNTIVTKKPGQWFGPHMNERFDHVLCDAPCTAQGTARKNPEALDFCSSESIAKMAGLQIELLESAIHSAKIGGHIVYSTCTLTPEENEFVVQKILNKFSDQISIVDPRTLSLGTWDCTKAVEDSITVQRCEGMEEALPCIRIWPHAHNVEGFFCAVLEKKAATMDAEWQKWIHRQEREFRHVQQKKADTVLSEQFGTAFRAEHEQLWSLDDQVLLINEAAASLPLPTQDFCMGLPFAKAVRDDLYRLTNEVVTLRGIDATTNIIQLNDEQLDAVLSGADTTCSKDLSGDVVLLWNDIPLGIGLAQRGILKNRLSRWLVQLAADR